jgi:MFS family permease
LPEPSLLRSARFRTVWGGEIGARVGYQISLFMLPLLVATVLHGRATQVGMASAAQTLPAIALSLTAGALVSRIPARRLLVVTNLVRLAAFGSLGVLYAAEGLAVWSVVAMAIVIGSASVFYDVGFQVVLPRLVPPGQLVPANGFVQATTSASQMLGPAAAGFLIESLHPPLAVAAVTVLFGAAAVLFGVLRVPAETSAAASKVSIREGLAFIWRCRPIRDLCVQSGLFNLHEQAFLTVFLLYGLHVLHISGAEIGAIISMGSVGALAGSLAAGPVGGRLHLGRTLSGAICAASLALLLLPVLAGVGAPTPLLGIGFALNGAGLALYNVFAISLRQKIPPRDFLGPVTAMYRLAVFGMMPIGSLLGGILADRLGNAAALWIITISLTTSSAVLFLSPLRRIRSADEAQVMTSQRRLAEA